MTILRIEHRVEDFDGWKRNGFDADPIGRPGSRISAYVGSRARRAPSPCRRIVGGQELRDKWAVNIRSVPVSTTASTGA